MLIPMHFTTQFASSTNTLLPPVSIADNIAAPLPAAYASNTDERKLNEIISCVWQLCKVLLLVIVLQL